MQRDGADARIVELEAELSSALAYHKATAEILEVISRSPNELQPVLEAIAERAAQLCEAMDCVALLRTGDRLAHRAHFGPIQLDVTELPISRGTVSARCVVERKTIHVHDIQSEQESYPEGFEVAVRVGYHTVLGAPLMRDNEAIGSLVLRRMEIKPFSEEQIGLVRTFAAQAVIAIENARLFEAEQLRTQELQQSLEYQAASGEVLSIISRSPTNVRPVFDAIVESAAKLCESDVSVVHLCVGDKLHPAATWNWTSAARQHLESELTKLDRSHLSGRAILERKTVHVSDVLEDSEYSHSLALDGSWRAVLAVPMLRDDNPVGAIAIAKTKPSAFTDRQVSLLENFADQAVIAVENARLFEAEQERTHELQEALEQQTATSKVLRTISSSPGKIEPVFDAILASARELCDAAYGHLLLFDGQAWRAAALHNLPDAYAKWWSNRSVKAGAPTVLHRLAQQGRPIQVEDFLEGPSYGTRTPLSVATAELGKARTFLGVPLVKDGTVIGGIVLYRREVRPFDEKQIALLASFADQAVIAIENARLFEAEQERRKELRESLEYQIATSDVLESIANSATDNQPVFDAIVTNAARLCGANFSSIVLSDGKMLHLAALNNLSDSAAAVQSSNFPMIPDRSQVSCRAFLDRKVVQVIDVLKDSDYSQKLALAGGWRSLMGVPLMRKGQAIGAIAVAKSEPLPYSQQQVDLISTFARQAVIAIENARLFDDIQERQQELAKSLEELQSLREVGQAVSSSLNMTEVLQTILENAVRMADAGGGAIYVFKPETEDFHLSANLNMHDELIGRVRAQPLGLSDPVVGDCARQRQAVQIEDMTQEDVGRSPLLDLLFRAGVRSIMAVPLLRHDEVVGALVIRRGHAGSFSTETVNLLETFAAQSAIAVNNARLFEEVARKSVELEIASKHKSQFVANMSHELRTPLAAILGYTELLVDGLFGELPDKAVTTLERIQSNGKHLLGLINAVLDISKIEAGQFSLNLGEYAVSNLVETVRVATESLASGKGIGLYAEVAPDLPHGFGDEPRLTQVLLNLVGNAIKFTDKGEVRITARAKDDAFVIDVHDTGPGIPPAERARIFEEFHQVDSSDTRVKGGTGLGLAIARRIVEMHGGRIWVESELGAGATFRISLPVRTTAQVAAA